MDDIAAPTRFHATVDAARVLGIDADYRGQLEAALKRIPDLKIGKHGQLQEWSEEYDEPSPGMSRVSHLFALFPSDEITLRGTPEVAKAARISLERRLREWRQGEASAIGTSRRNRLKSLT